MTLREASGESGPGIDDEVRGGMPSKDEAASVRGWKPAYGPDAGPERAHPDAIPLAAQGRVSQALTEELLTTTDELVETQLERDRLHEALKRVNAELERKIGQLQTVNADLGNLLWSLDVAAAFLDRDLRLQRFTPAARELLGLGDGDIGRPANDIAAMTDDLDLVADARRVWDHLRPLERDVADRQGRCYVRRTTPYRTVQHRIEGVVVTYLDITERKQAERSLQALNDELEARVRERTVELDRERESLAEQHEILETTLRSIVEGVLVVDRNGRVRLENQAAVQIVGYSALETDAADWCEAVGAHAPDGTALLALQDRPTRRALNGEETHGTELVLHGRQGDRRIVVEVWAAPLRRRDGEIIGAILNFRDVAQRKRAAEVEARLAALVRSTRAAVVTWTPEGAIVDWNEGAVHMFGYAAREICGRGIEVLSLAGERRALCGRLHPQVYDRELQMRHKDGRAVHVAWTVAPVLDATGRTLGLAAVGSDVSDRARLERQVALMADEQRQQLGRDLHDSLGQQLTALGLLASALQTRAGTGQPVLDVSARIEHGIDTAKLQLRAIVKGLSPVELDARGLVVALSELAVDIGQTHGVDCRLHCAESVRVDDGFVANQLYLIAREAVHNAIKHADPHSVVIHLEDANGLTLRVVDDGRGIARADDRRPHQGMGLRIMRYRARIIGAILTIERGPAGGTTLICACSLPPASTRMVPPEAGLTGWMMQA
jgi:PAS domain S-box-containing protein